ncbi:MAG: hypothetical protein IIU47_00595, partial [Lachnospiraceae bacterium]|nr:hypothetical protein [Lachnospiraceae bacterium]
SGSILPDVLVFILTQSSSADIRVKKVRMQNLPEAYPAGTGRTYKNPSGMRRRDSCKGGV